MDEKCVQTFYQSLRLSDAVISQTGAVFFPVFRALVTANKTPEMEDDRRRFRDRSLVTFISICTPKSISTNNAVFMNAIFFEEIASYRRMRESSSTFSSTKFFDGFANLIVGLEPLEAILKPIYWKNEFRCHLSVIV